MRCSVAAASLVARQLNGELSTFNKNHFEFEVKDEGTYVMSQEQSLISASFLGAGDSNIFEEEEECGYGIAEDLLDLYGPKEKSPDRKAELIATIDRLKRVRNRNRRLENKLFR
ncbi:unnamed protein product [Microthlaspi erraticum]|uniref:Uncharacterized protein n=1 Tax=Microthlaspi erraticum TaxID=1685480 RepID=A0A6D2J854_9BRAS|nr:unnamed protein product [Microthlaspi erraticum]